MDRTWIRQLLVVGAALAAGLSVGQAKSQSGLETVEVEGRRVNLLGSAISASEGLIGQAEIALRPLLRTGEVLELVPGMVVTQHSGTGKANQYFLRGFNLDHGTDFATFVDGMPLNMRSHGHGQGYTDLNPIIPEALSAIAYRKGPYHADVGDFSGAGSAQFRLADRVEKGLAELSLGEDAYRRLVAVDSSRALGGDWLYAAELNSYDGPWRGLEEDLERFNGLLRHTRELGAGRLSVTAMAYDNQWNSADQIPSRAVAQGLISRRGVIDPTVGGKSSRYSLSARWHDQQWELSAYSIRHDLNLWSNFTYFLDDPENGDQFEQVDERWIHGGSGSYRWEDSIFGRPVTQRLGLELRYDDIDEVGLYRSVERRRLGSIRSDAVEEFSTGLFWDAELVWSDRLRTVVGARYDYYDFEVDGRVARNLQGVDLRPNSGSADDGLLSLKGSVILALDDDWEAYAAAGQGFHSNDARGTTIRVDPADGSAVPRVDPLVESLGAELGLRGVWAERLNTSVAIWYLELDSELVFVGDAGNTEASGETRRHGLEVTAYYSINSRWTADFEYAWSDARFTRATAGGREIPGAVEHVLQAGVSLTDWKGWYGSLRLRYFGERPLVEDGSVEADATTVVNLLVGRQLAPNWRLSAELLNLLDSRDHDIDYFYASQLPGEAEAVEDVHYHIMEPRTLRLGLTWSF